MGDGTLLPRNTQQNSKPNWNRPVLQVSSEGRAGPLRQDAELAWEGWQQPYPAQAEMESLLVTTAGHFPSSFTWLLALSCVWFNRISITVLTYCLRPWEPIQHCLLALASFTMIQFFSSRLSCPLLVLLLPQGALHSSLRTHIPPVFLLKTCSLWTQGQLEQTEIFLLTCSDLHIENESQGLSPIQICHLCGSPWAYITFA